MPAGTRGHTAPRDVAVRWAATLVEPLLGLGVRQELDAAMAQLCRDHERYAATLFGGVLADMVCTLPDGDPWRSLSGRLGPLATSGASPAHSVGAWYRDGRAFGTVTDSEDVVKRIFPDPILDISLTAVAYRLRPESSALIAFAATGWQECVKAVEAVIDGKPIYDDSRAPVTRGHLGAVADIEQPRTDDEMCAYGILADALRWAIHRRRSVAVAMLDDAWPIESIYRWALRAERVVAGDAWPELTVDRDIILNRLLPPPDDDEF